MKVVISNLAEGEHFYIFKQSLETLELNDIEVQGDIDVNVRLNKFYEQIYVYIEFYGQVNFPCDRCMENFVTAINGSYGLTYKFISNINGKNNEDVEDADTYYILPDTNTIDLSQTLRDYIILSVPMKRAPEEKNGVCTYCKKNIDELFKKNISDNIEINPVWNKLINNKNIE